MNESNFENLIKAYRKVQMTPDEKREVFKQSMLVIEKIEAVSLIHSDKTTEEAPGFSIFSPEFSGEVQKGKAIFSQNFISYIKRRQFVPALIASFLLLFTGGASLLAEQALPGDSLYSFKVNVNEPLRDFTAVTDEAKAKLAVEVTTKRLQEAAVLSAQGNLNEDNKKILQDQFVKSAEEIRNRVASLVSKNNLNAAQEVVVDFESALTTHELILESLSLNTNTNVAATSSDPAATADATSTNPDSQIATAAQPKKIAAQPEVVALLVTLKSELDSTKTSRINIQEKVLASYGSSTDTSSKTSASTQTVFDANIKELRFTITDIQSELKAYAYASTTIELVNTRLANASSSIGKINILLKANKVNEATTKSRAVLRNLAEIQVILKVEKNSKANLDGKVNIETLLKNGENQDEKDGEGTATSTPSEQFIIDAASATSTDSVHGTIVK